jgi:transcription initiation factor TFIIIB Brf1 subunit/transcription initiation factor TFIIB
MRCMLSCPYCKGKIVLQSHEYVCTKCGIVHYTEHVYHQERRRAKDVYKSHNTPCDITAFGLAVTDHKPLKDIVHVKTLPASLIAPNRQLSHHITVITCLDTIRDRLGIPEYIIHEAYNLFKRYRKIRGTGRAMSLKVMLSACVIIALKQHNHSRSFEELAEVLDIDDAGQIRRAHNDIIKSLNIHFVYNNAEDTLSKIVKDFHLKPSDVREIRRIMDKLKEITLKEGTAPTPRLITVTAVYIYFKRNGLFKNRWYELEDHATGHSIHRLYHLYTMKERYIINGEGRQGIQDH